MAIETIVTLVVALLWEQYLGTTKKIDANSTSQLIVSIIKKIFKR